MILKTVFQLPQPMDRNSSALSGRLRFGVDSQGAGTEVWAHPIQSPPEGPPHLLQLGDGHVRISQLLLRVESEAVMANQVRLDSPFSLDPVPKVQTYLCLCRSKQTKRGLPPQKNTHAVDGQNPLRAKWICPSTAGSIGIHGFSVARSQLTS